MSLLVRGDTHKARTVSAARVLILAALVAPCTLGAQVVPLGPRRADAWAVPVAAPVAPIDFPGVSPGIATAASLAFPGSGQLILGQGRWALYVGLELTGWLVALDHRRTGHRQRSEYFDLSWMVARSGGTGPRQDDGDWEYYERMGSWLRSGSYDADPFRAGVQPEEDLKSFNGATWVLAKDLYLPAGAGETNPAYARALEYYEKRAYPAEQRWDWTGREASMIEYRNLITRSDEALRTATVVLGAVVANHLLSAVDAFVSSHAPARARVVTSAALRSVGTAPVLEWSVEIRP